MPINQMFFSFHSRCLCCHDLCLLLFSYLCKIKQNKKRFCSVRRHDLQDITSFSSALYLSLLSMPFSVLIPFLSLASAAYLVGDANHYHHKVTIIVMYSHKSDRPLANLGTCSFICQSTSAGDGKKTFYLRFKLPPDTCLIPSHTLS